MNKEEIFEEILRYPIWRQRIPLNDKGFTTMGYLSLPGEWEFNHLPQQLNGKSFLDVGSNDGYFCFEAERRGAVVSTATDIYHDGGNSNRTGWSVKGVSLIKDYLSSTVDIKSQSIYELDKLGKTYDAVLCSNVISWLDNMNEAISQLSAVCKDTLYLKDGFLMRYDPDPVLIYEKPKNLVNFRANLSYMKAVLHQNGFKHIEVKPLYHYKYFDWQTEAFDGVQNEEAMQLYSSPQSQEPSKKEVVKGAWILAEYNGFLFLRNFGWVKSSDVRRGPRFKRSWKSQILRAIMSEDQLNDYIRASGSEPYVKSHMIIAKK